jgi:hypothetical protein
MRATKHAETRDGRLLRAMADAKWHDIQEMAAITGYPECSVSAGLRGLRNQAKCPIQTMRAGGGRHDFLYRLNVIHLARHWPHHRLSLKRKS